MILDFMNNTLQIKAEITEIDVAMRLGKKQNTDINILVKFLAQHKVCELFGNRNK